MEKTRNGENSAMKIKHPILVVVIHNCAHESYWYKDWAGHHISVIAFPDYYVVHTDYVDNNGPYRMIDKGDADVVGRLTATKEEELIFSERLAHDPAKELDALLGKKMPDLSKPNWNEKDKVWQYKVKIPGDIMDNEIIADAKRNIEDIDTDNQIACALADIYGMRAALRAVMNWFNKDCVSVPEWIYELVTTRINKSNAYGITNEETAVHHICQWKKDFPNWHEQEKECETKLTRKPILLENDILMKEHIMLARLADYVLGNFLGERDFEKEDVVTFVIRVLERYKRLRGGDIQRELFEIEEYVERNFASDFTEPTESTASSVIFLLEQLANMRSNANKDTSHASDAFRYVLGAGGRGAGKTAEYLMKEMKNLQAYLKENFPDAETDVPWDTTVEDTKKLLEELKGYRNTRIIERSDSYQSLIKFMDENFNTVLHEDLETEIKNMLMELKARRYTMNENSSDPVNFFEQGQNKRFEEYQLGGCRGTVRIESGDAEMTKSRLDGYEMLIQYLKVNFKDQWLTEYETAADCIIKLLGEFTQFKSLDRLRESAKIMSDMSINTLTIEHANKWLSVAEYVKLNWNPPAESINAGYVHDMLGKLLNYEKINRLQGMPLHPLLLKNEELAAFLLKEFPNDPGRLGDEVPIDVAIRLLTEYAKGFNVAEGLLLFFGWYNQCVSPHEHSTKCAPSNMVPLVHKFLEDHRLPIYRKPYQYYLELHKARTFNAAGG